MVAFGRLAAVRVGSGAASTDATAMKRQSPSASPSPDTFEIDKQPLARGHCYTWNQEDHNATADEVPYGSPHLFEAVKEMNIASDYPPDSADPTDAQWNAITKRYCDPIPRSFLGYPLDPYGRFASGIIRPIRFGWESGDRDLACGLIAVGKYAQLMDTPVSAGITVTGRGRVDKREAILAARLRPPSAEVIRPPGRGRAGPQPRDV